MPDNFGVFARPLPTLICSWILGATAGCQSTALLGSPVCLLATTGLSVPLGIVEIFITHAKEANLALVRGFGRASRYGSWSCEVQGSLRGRGMPLQDGVRWTLVDQCVKRVLLSRVSQDQERSHQRQRPGRDERSLLLICNCSPDLLSSDHSQVDVAPVSSPTRATCSVCDLTNAAIVSGLDATIPSRSIFPVRSTMQIAVSLSDTTPLGISSPGVDEALTSCVQSQGCRGPKACGHSAPDVDRRQRVQVVIKGGC